MQELIPINIVVGDRNYRVRIDARDEEKVRLLIRKINDQLLDFKTKFAGKDMQDYVAMVLLWFVTEQQDGQLNPDLAQVTERLDALEALLDQPFKP
ncbi:MAG: cell division protein ZapA [Chitinophagaceae bacterium]|jgi:cell division protein ZapA|nr:cell division protein ZapA [Chitinophagaceae bacterium]